MVRNWRNPDILERFRHLSLGALRLTHLTHHHARPATANPAYPALSSDTNGRSSRDLLFTRSSQYSRPAHMTLPIIPFLDFGPGLNRAS